MNYRYFSIVLFFVCTCWVAYGQDIHYDNYMMYKRVGRDVIDLGLVGKTQLRDSTVFYPYKKAVDSTFKIDTTQKLGITVYSDTSYYSKIRKGEKIDFAYIPVLDFSYLGHWQYHSFYVDYRIDITSCIIQEIIFPNFSNIGTIGIQDTVVFNQDFALNYCTFNLRGEKLTFNGNVTLYDPITVGKDIMPYYFVNTLFRKKLTFYPYINEGDDFWMKKYISTVSFNNRLQEFEFSHCTFNSIDFKAHLSNSDFRFENCTFDNRVSIYKLDTTSKLFFKNCICNSYFLFENIDKYTFLENTTFRDSLDLYNVRLDAYIGDGFNGANFKDNATVILNPDAYNLRKLNFNFMAIQKINIPFRVQQSDVDFLMIQMTSKPNPEPVGINTFFVDKLDEAVFDRSQNFYINLQREVEILYDKQPDVINNLKAKFQYQAKQYEKQYHRDQLRLNGVSGLMRHGAPLLWLTITEFVVHNGYHGELNFFLTFLYTILLFAIFYFRFFQADIVKHFDGIDIVLEFRRGKFQKYTVKNFAKCLWQSSVIFINPKLSKKYFEFSSRAFYFVCVEWLLGLGLIILFFVYIAVNYPFVKALVGI